MTERQAVLTLLPEHNWSKSFDIMSLEILLEKYKNYDFYIPIKINLT